MVAPLTKPYQLLIADDDSVFRETLRGILEPYLRMFEASSGEEAIEIVECQRVDIVLVDMHMDVLTGLETLQIVKSIDSIIPCILVTADASDQLRRNADEADAYSVLSKPIRKSDLLATVSSALEETYRDPDALPGWPLNS